MCSCCKLKKYKSGTKFPTHFGMKAVYLDNINQDTNETIVDGEDCVDVYLGKDMLIDKYFMYVYHESEDYDLRQHKVDFKFPIYFCPMCGEKLY